MEDLVSHREKGDDDFTNQNHMSSFNEEEEFLKDIIIQQPVFSPENPSSSSIQSNFGATIVDPCGAATATSTTNSGSTLDGYGTLLKSCSSSNNFITLDKPPSCILSFVEPVYHSQQHHHSALMSSKSRPRTKKVRNSSETEFHIMAERKRRLELTRSIITLSSTIPGLKKTDKAYVLHEAVKYVKQLQERVRELENQNRKERLDSIIFMKKTQLCINEATHSCKKHSNGCSECIEELPNVEATVLEKEVLIGIHCEKKQRQSFLKIMSFLNNLHFSITSTSILPFGTSTVKITIIAQMDDEYNMTIDDLVKTLRQHLLNLKSQGYAKVIRASK